MTTDDDAAAFHDAIVVAGGGGERLGGVEKADLMVNGRQLLEVALSAVRDASAVVVVGRTAVPDGVLATMEDPPGGGPAAAVQAGLRALRSPERRSIERSESKPFTAVLAVDHPGAEQAMADLLAAVDPDDAEADGWCLQHRDGTPQWLFAIYRTSRLAEVLSGDVSNRSMRRTVGGLTLRPIPTTADLTDVDTPDDLAHWGIPG